MSCDLLKMALSTCRMRVRVIFAVIGLSVGISIFFCFGIVYYNWDTAAWGLLSGIMFAIRNIFRNK